MQNFEALILEIKEQRGFQDYEKPLGPVVQDFHLKNPRYPTHFAYSNDGLYLLQHVLLDIPQELIRANLRSSLDGINLFMPLRATSQFMHSYFRSDFLTSRSFLERMNRLTFPRTYKGRLDGAYTMQLERPERRRHDRRLYTEREIDITQQIGRQVPQIVLSIIAYQSVFAEYLAQLSQAMTCSPDLSKDERSRGLGIVGTLALGFKTNNFLDYILPAVALQYYRRQGGTIGEPPNQRDFEKGMSFAQWSGMFRNAAVGPRGDIKRFKCPAEQFLSRTSSIDIENSGVASTPEIVGIGASLYQINAIIESKFEEGTPAIKEAVRGVIRMIDSAQNDFRQQATVRPQRELTEVPAAARKKIRRDSAESRIPLAKLFRQKPAQLAAKARAALKARKRRR